MTTMPLVMSLVAADRLRHDVDATDAMRSITAFRKPFAIGDLFNLSRHQRAARPVSTVEGAVRKVRSS